MSTAPVMSPAPEHRRPSLTAFRTLRPDLVEVTVGHRQIGYIEMVGHLFVALRGERYDTAVEVRQSMSIEEATRALSS